MDKEDVAVMNAEAGAAAEAEEEVVVAATK